MLHVFAAGNQIKWTCKAVFLLIFLIVNLPASAQVLTIQDRETRKPLEFATVASNDPVAFTTTNTKGQANLKPFSNAKEIEIRLVGYKPVITSFSELEDMGFNLTLKPSEISLDQVVVSATRWNQSAMNVPTRITSIKPKDMVLQNPQTAADLLGQSGEVFIQKSQQGGGSPMIRGFSTNRLLYTVDGVRMNTAIFRSGNLQNVISLDPFAMESAEILFGPGSIIYGSDAIGGVMSFQTLTPQFATAEAPYIGGKATARYSSSNNEKTGHAHLNIGWKKWASVTSISHNNYGDLMMGKVGPDEYLRNYYVIRRDSTDVIADNPDPRIQKPSGYSQTNLMQKVRFRPNNHWDATYGFHYSTTSNYSRYDRLIQTRNALPRYGRWDYGPQVWMMNNLNLTHLRETAFYTKATVRLAHQYFRESRISRGFNERIQSENIEMVDANSMTLDLYKNLSNITSLFYGIDLVWNDVRSEGMEKNIITNTEVPGPQRYPQATWSSYAAYLTIQHYFTDQLIVKSGMRYNFFRVFTDFSKNLPYYPFEGSQSTLNDGALTGSLGVVYHPKPSWSISTNLSTGFRAPNVDDIGKVFDSAPPFVVVPNTDLEAEYAYNAEFGLAKVFGEAVKADLTAYYTLLNNAMVRRDFTLNGEDSIVYDGQVSKVQAIQNATQSQVYGLQAGLEVKLPAGFSLSSQFNYQEGREELENGSTSPSRHAAPWFGITRLTYKYKGLEIQLYGVYNGKRPFSEMPEEEKDKPYIYAMNKNGTPYSPGWYTLNFKGLYPVNDFISVSAGVENLTDQRYRPYSSGLVAPGRNFILSIQSKF